MHTNVPGHFDFQRYVAFGSWSMIESLRRSNVYADQRRRPPSIDVLIATSAAHSSYRSPRHRHHQTQTWTQNRQDCPQLHLKPSHPHPPASNSSAAILTWQQLQIQSPAVVAVRQTRKSLELGVWHLQPTRWNPFRLRTRLGKEETTLEDRLIFWDRRLSHRPLWRMLLLMIWLASTLTRTNIINSNLHRLERPRQEG